MIIELLRKFQTIGYRVTLNGNKISLDFIGEVLPGDAVIVPLVDSLKELKAEVVEFLRQGDYESVFNKAVGEVQSKYKGGEIAFARMNKPELFNQSAEAENRISGHWGNDFSAFSAAVADWKSFCFSMISLHRNAEKYLCACGNPGERLMLGIRAGKYGGYWHCLKCCPYQKRNN